MSQRAGGQDSSSHRHVSKHCTLVAMPPTTQHIAFCTASTSAPMPVLQHKNGAKQSKSVLDLSQAGAAALPGSFL